MSDNVQELINYEFILESISEGVVLFDKNYRYLLYNDAFSRIVRIAKKDLKGKSMFDFYPDIRETEFFNAYEKVFKTGKTSTVLNDYVFDDGSQRWFENRVIPVQGAGDVEQILVIIKDVTAQQLTELSLKESEILYRTTFEQSADGIIIMDLETTKAIEYNNAICEMLGYSREEFSKLNISDIDINEDSSDTKAHAEKVLQQGRDDFDAKMRSKNGEIKDVHVITKVIELSGKKYYQSIWHDITESKKTEQRLKESENLYRTTVNGLQDILHVINHNLEINLLNDSLKQYVKNLNLNTNLIGRPISEVFPFLPEKILNEYRSVFSKKSPMVTVESTFIDKKEYTTETRKIPIFDDEENVIQVITIIRDITKRKKAEHKLKESEEKWRALSENSPAHIMLLDQDHKILSINRTVPDLSKEEVIGTSVYNYVPPEFHQIAKEEFKSVIETGKPGSFITKYITKDGSTRFFDIRVSPVFEAGKIVAIINHSLDVTERKESEQKLKESEEKYRGFLDFGNIGMAITSLDKEWIYFNDQICEIFGFTREELIEKTWEDLSHPEDLEIDISQFNKILEGKIDNYQIDKRFIKNDGKIIYGHLTMSCIRNSDRTVKHFLATLQNTTERKKAEQKLLESEERYRNFVQNIQGIAYQGYQDFSAALFEGAVDEITGYTSEDFLTGRIRWDNIIHPDDALLKKKEVQTFHSSSAEDDSREYRIISKNGEIRWILDKFQKIYDKEKKIEGVQGIIVDITERKEAENELKELTRMKSEFLRRASHELKTPLISIKGFSDLILSLYIDQLDPVIISKIREINDGCERLQNIINNLLKASRLESPDLKPKIQKEDLSFLIKFCVHELESLAERRNQSIKLAIQNDLYANIEKEEVHDVISNLLTNAIKYTPPLGKIEIKAVSEGDHVVVSVKDNGIGFTDEQKKKIFQQFGKIERYGQGLDLGIDGTGLGLYISKKIVESHGGKIWMESEGISKGSTFYFSLPALGS